MTVTREETVNRVRAELPTFLHGRRLTHTLAVEKEILSLAEPFCMTDALTVDENTLRVAALLHDMTKQSEQKALCEQYGIDGGAVTSPELLHALTGAKAAGEKYAVDETVCEAIRCHTTGKVGMTLFEKLLFLADFTEPNRVHESCAEVRAYVHTALRDAKTLGERLRVIDIACIKSIDATLSHLLATGMPIEPRTVAARNDLLCAFMKGKIDAGAR